MTRQPCISDTAAYRELVVNGPPGEPDYQPPAGADAEVAAILADMAKLQARIRAVAGHFSCRGAQARFDEVAEYLDHDAAELRAALARTHEDQAEEDADPDIQAATEADWRNDCRRERDL